jgi:hypothetical protein
LPKTFSCEEIRENGNRRQMRRTGGFLENAALSVNAISNKLRKQKQYLINMVQYYRKKLYVFGME